MKSTERDELLIRLDEKTGVILGAQEETRDHLKELNGKVANNCKVIAVQEEQIKVVNHRIDDLEQIAQSQMIPGFSRRQKVVGGSGIGVVIITIIFGVGQAAGWW